MLRKRGVPLLLGLFSVAVQNTCTVLQPPGVTLSITLFFRAFENVKCKTKLKPKQHQKTNKTEKKQQLFKTFINIICRKVVVKLVTARNSATEVSIGRFKRKHEIS